MILQKSFRYSDLLLKKNIYYNNVENSWVDYFRFLWWIERSEEQHLSEIEIFCIIINVLINLNMGPSNLILEGRCPAEFSLPAEVSGLSSKSLISCFRCLEGRCPAEFSLPAEVSGLSSKSLISCFRCLIRVGAKLCRTAALQDQTLWPLI